MKKLFLSLIGIFIFLSSINLGISLGPNMHVNTSIQAWNDQSVNGTLINDLIHNNLDACYVGLEYPDVGIFEYYTNFKAYAGLHNYNVPEEMLKVARNDRDRAFAYCYKIHLAEDSVSHNFFVPAAIKRTFLPNYIVHPIVELKEESKFLTPISNHMMEKHKEFDWLVEQATGRDWSSEADKLNTIIGGSQFYSKAYTPDTGTWWGHFQNYFYIIIGKFVPKNSAVNVQALAIEEAKGVLRGETNDLDPSGEAALNAADASTNLWLYVFTFVIAIIIFGLSFYFKIIGFSRK